MQLLLSDRQCLTNYTLQLLESNLQEGSIADVPDSSKYNDWANFSAFLLKDSLIELCPKTILFHTYIEIDYQIILVLLKFLINLMETIFTLLTKRRFQQIY